MGRDRSVQARKDPTEGQMDWRSLIDSLNAWQQTNPCIPVIER